VNFLEKNADVGMVGPLLLHGITKNNPKIQLFGGDVNLRTQKKKSFYADAFLNDISLPEELRVNMINAGSFLIRSEIIANNYLFEESYFIYNDEIDIAHRIKDKGYGIAAISLAKVWHYHDWTAKNTSGYNLMYYYMMRNKMLYYWKFNMQLRLIVEFIKQLSLAPVVLHFCYKTSHPSMFIFYYLGLLHGLTGKTGKAKINLN
jgi:GT2 family glycosyltransferase